MSVFDDEPPHAVRTGADWEQHRRHRRPETGPPQDEVGVLALSAFVLARGDDAVVAVRGATAYSDGLLLTVLALFADEQQAEDLELSVQEYGRGPGRLRFGAVFSDGRRATTGAREAPGLVPPPSGAAMVQQRSRTGVLQWEAEQWLWPLPPPGELVLACRWPDRGIPETTVSLDAGPLLQRAATSVCVWSTA